MWCNATLATRESPCEMRSSDDMCRYGFINYYSTTQIITL